MRTPRKSTSKVSREGTPGSPDFVTEHPLFPLPADTDDASLSERKIGWIYVFRDGVMFPEAFHHSSLQGPEDLALRWGGGTYELKARDPDRRRWTALGQAAIAGAKRPFVAAEDLAPPPPAATSAPPFYPYPPPAQSPNFLEILTALGAIVTPIATAMISRKDADLELRRTEAQEQNKLFLGILQNQATQNQHLMTRALEATPGRGLDADKIIGALKEAGQNSDASTQALLEQAVGAFQAYADLQYAKAAQYAVVNGQPVPPPPPGGAPTPPGGAS